MANESEKSKDQNDHGDCKVLECLDKAIDLAIAKATVVALEEGGDEDIAEATLHACSHLIHTAVRLLWVQCDENPVKAGKVLMRMLQKVGEENGVAIVPHVVGGEVKGDGQAAIEGAFNASDKAKMN